MQCFQWVYQEIQLYGRNIQLYDRNLKYICGKGELLNNCKICLRLKTQNITSKWDYVKMITLFEPGGSLSVPFLDCTA